jgi:hypothetical protein
VIKFVSDLRQVDGFLRVAELDVVCHGESNVWDKGYSTVFDIERQTAKTMKNL